MFSRSGRKKPPRCSPLASSPSGGGGGGMSVMNSSRQVRAMAAEDTCEAKPLSRGLFDERLERLIRPQLPRDDLRHAVPTHAHAVEDVGRIHGPLLVGDDD